MASIELRQATPADAAAIRDLTRAAYAKWVPLIGREPKPMTADYEVALREHRFDLLISGDVLAALIETVEEDGQLLIVNVAVAPRFQRQGFGRTLLAHAERLARDLGKGRVRLYTNQCFIQNIRLYERLGYTIDREEDLGVVIAVHMSKAVDGKGRITAFPTRRGPSVGPRPSARRRLRASRAAIACFRPFLTYQVSPKNRRGRSTAKRNNDGQGAQKCASWGSAS